jgi:hypothetical protein
MVLVAHQQPEHLGVELAAVDRSREVKGAWLARRKRTADPGFSSVLAVDFPFACGSLAQVIPTAHPSH